VAGKLETQLTGTTYGDVHVVGIVTVDGA